MAKIKLTTSKLINKPEGDGFRILMDCARTPCKIVEAKNLAEIHSHMDTFAAELGTGDRPWMINADVVSGRKPAGFDKAEKELRRFVNTHLLPKDERSNYDWTGYEYEDKAA